MRMKILIVDDEPLGRDRIRSLLAGEPNVEVVGEAEDVPGAMEAIGRLRPDLVFLDIQMPGGTGFDVLRGLEEPLPMVVFVTAYDAHAVKAFEARALDYLLKPARPARVKEAVARARERWGMREVDEVPRRLLELLKAQETRPMPVTRLPVRNNERTIFVKVGQVDWVEAAGNYVLLHVGRESHALRETLGALEAQLPPQFLRVSRSALVNLERVKELQSMAAGEHVVLLQDGQKVPMTRGVREVEERLRYG
jgi:two-component system LytT family response regulator